MIRKFYLAIALLFTLCTFAQVPQMMSYQAVIRNSSGALISNSAIGMRVSILQGSVTGTPVYVETQTPPTNSNGLVSINIGAGTVVTGTFSAIDWESGPYFIKTETDPAGGTNYSITSTSQLLSVPYALYSGNGGFSNFQVFSTSGNFVVPTGVKKIMIEVWGAGGGGAGTNTAANVGGGGGGGYGKGIFNVVPGTNYSVTVGGGGSGAMNANGNTGGSSSFDILITATGGTGGINGGGHGQGGSANGPINITGGIGDSGFGNPGFGGSAGGGGGSGAPGGGNSGTTPGGGGSGGGSGTGGNGGDGRVVVWW